MDYELLSVVLITTGVLVYIYLIAKKSLFLPSLC